MEDLSVSESAKLILGTDLGFEEPRSGISKPPKYDELFTTDKNLIQTVIESSPDSEEIEPKVILNINKQLILSSYPKSYTHIMNDKEYDMLVKYINKYSIRTNKL
jgi:hypothetical protein